MLCCLDCGKNFHGDDYKDHTSCISEAEKYQGKLFKPKDKQNKGERKQQEWLKVFSFKKKMSYFNFTGNYKLTVQKYWRHRRITEA